MPAGPAIGVDHITRPSAGLSRRTSSAPITSTVLYVPAEMNWFVRRLRTEIRRSWIQRGFGASADGSSSTPCGRRELPR